MMRAERGAGFRDRGSAGFTLIETLCALSILALCLAGVTQICTEALRARARADRVEVAAEFLEALAADLALNQPSGAFDASSWVTRASKMGWRLDIQRIPMPEFEGLMSVEIVLETGQRGGRIRLNRICRGTLS